MKRNVLINLLTGILILLFISGCSSGEESKKISNEGTQTSKE